MDPILSGRYLVTSLKHMVLPLESMHSMVMTVMKDSVENATPVRETTYPDPPKGKADIGLSNTKRKLRPKTKNPHLSSSAPKSRSNPHL
jgi:hypothetical protein